jgi:V/A-type H+-transporting ATPase subunit K
VDIWFAGFTRDLGIVSTLVLASIGSSFGVMAAGLAAVGAIKKCALQNKVAPFILIVYVAAPISQTIYGMILMNSLIQNLSKSPYIGMFGILAGIGLGVSAYGQGKIGAAAADAAGETGKGDAKFLIALGIIETVALFVMVFSMMGLGNLPVAVTP